MERDELYEVVLPVEMDQESQQITKLTIDTDAGYRFTYTDRDWSYGRDSRVIPTIAFTEMTKERIDE